jgi:tetratricopeptide (TPR) repeat protein
MAENHPSEAQEPSEQSAGATEVPARSALPTLARFGLFTFLFVGGLLGSWLFRHFTQDETKTDAIVEEPAKVRKIEAAGSPMESLARGDELLQGHLYGAALVHYEEIMEGATGGVPLVDYRLGLCLESLGKIDSAVGAYRRAITAGENPNLIFASHLGMARCLLRRNQPAEARRLLYPFVLDEKRRSGSFPPLVSDARYLIALAFVREGMNSEPELVTEDRPVAYTVAALYFPFYLEETSSRGQEKKEVLPETPNPLPPVHGAKEQLPAPTPNVVERPEQSAKELLDQLAKEAGWRGEWTPAAVKAIQDRTLRLAVRDWPIHELLEQAADNFGLVCQVEGQVVRFQTREEMDKSRWLEAQRPIAWRALRAAIFEDGTHAWKSAAWLELGNNEAAQGRLPAAVAWLEKIVRQGRGSPWLAPAYYNLARLHLAKRDYDKARQAFYHVIDQSPGHELALRAYLQLGQLYLEENDAKTAVALLRRGHLLAPQSAYHPLAILELGAAYLQNQEPEQTRLLMAKERNSLQKNPFKSTANFLDIYAQFRLGKQDKINRRDASDLLGSLWQGQDDALLGPVGQRLIAQAYRDLGFWSEAEKVLRGAVKKTEGSLLPQLNYLLADTLLKQNQRDQAVKLLTKLAAAPSSHHYAALFQLAQLDFQDHHFQECVQKCRQLWPEHQGADTSALLKLWGAALEASGDPTRAAQCFAGTAPQ